MYRHPRRPLPLVPLVGLLVVAALSGCAPTRVQATFTKANVSEPQLNQDVAELRRTTGVEQVLPRHHLDNTVTIQLYLDEDNPLPGKQTAADLGYAQVRD